MRRRSESGSKRSAIAGLVRLLAAVVLVMAGLQAVGTGADATSTQAEPLNSAGPQWLPLIGSGINVFETWGDGYHPYPAIDFSVTNQPVYAAGDGVVRVRVVDPGNCYPTCEGSYGTHLIIEHDNGRASLYGHLSSINDDAGVGQRVHAGQRIATSGNSGYSTGAHLHYEERTSVNGARVDPGQTLACHGSTKKTYSNWPALQGSNIRNDGYGCLAPAGLKCDGKTPTIWGTDNGETLVGTDGPDVIHARGGQDTVYGNGGNDTICGGDHHDKLHGGNGGDTILGGDGWDEIWGNDGADYIYGQHDVDKLYGGDGIDRIWGGTQNDHIEGGNDKDYIYGEDGDDKHLKGGNGNDEIRGGTGNDTIWGDNGEDDLWGQNGDDDIHGGNNADDIWGGTNNDTVNGDGGDDRIWGEGGTDTLQGGDGHDLIKGGDDNDTLRGGDHNDKLYGENGNDDMGGGPGTDECHGGAGSGDKAANCETVTGVPSDPPSPPASTWTYTTGYTASENQALSYAVSYFGLPQSEIQRRGVGLLGFFIALSGDPGPRPYRPAPSTSGPHTYSSTWTTDDKPVLDVVANYYALTPEQAQKGGATLLAFFAALAG